MSITNELREWAHGPDEGDDWLDRIDEFCDRIDREHRTALEKVAAEVDALPMTDESMAEHGWIRLPVDADGVLIHVGDRLDGYGKTIEVVELRHGRSGWVLISRDGNAYADTFAFSHHHAPTVEDVLLEFAEKIIDSQIPGVHPTYEETIAEYAAKMRLVEGAEQ